MAKKIIVENSSVEEITRTWNNAINIDVKGGLREPQKGALYAIKAHWTVSTEPATIVLPTGTGKTETMIATIVSEQIHRTLVIVPSVLLRTQTADKISKFGVLKDISVINNAAKNPVVKALVATPKNKFELENCLIRHNVLVATMSLLKNFNYELMDLLKKYIDVVIFDEAHHIKADAWNSVKNNLNGIKMLQFTATPFRNDGKHIEGKFIYSFPLKKAQEQGYFKKIKYYPVIEYDDKKADDVIAKKAVELLSEDLKTGYNHILLVRAKDIISADRLYSEIYLKRYRQFNPVLVHSKAGGKEESLRKLRNSESHIVVCVDMFGEGIDIPNLKLCAMHNSYKSLPITLQFVGRFARENKNLGDAKIIANVADDSMSDSLADLYAEDSDWNYLISGLSDTAIQKEIDLKNVVNGFNPLLTEKLNLELLKPKMSAIVYRVLPNSKPNFWRLQNKFSKENQFVTINKELGLIMVAVQNVSSVEWSDYKGVVDKVWNLYLMCWDENSGLLFIYSSSKTEEDNIAKMLFDDVQRIRGEQTFRCLHNINRLLLASLGLKQEIRGPIRYKMFAGADVLEGVTESQRENHTKSNLFGYGFDGNGPVSIGCSYKGRIWGRDYGNIDEWLKWCKVQGAKLINSKINVDDIIKGLLKPKQVDCFLDSVVYAVDMPCNLDVCTDSHSTLIYNGKEYYFYDIGMEAKRLEGNNKIMHLRLYNANFEVMVEYGIKENDYYFRTVGSVKPKVRLGRREFSLDEFFYNNPPIIWYVDFASMQGNSLVEYSNHEIELNTKNIICQDWSGVDIEVESAKHTDKPESIQQKMMTFLAETNQYSIVFDDDDAGEIADIVAIREVDNTMCIELYHCKFSHGKNPGSRVADLYEVCGQAVKSLQWCKKIRQIPDRMKDRERLCAQKGQTRFRVGDMAALGIIGKKMNRMNVKMEISIVQPGVDSNKITDEMKRVICSASSHLMDTYSIPLKMYFS